MPPPRTARHRVVDAQTRAMGARAGFAPPQSEALIAAFGQMGARTAFSGRRVRPGEDADAWAAVASVSRDRALAWLRRTSLTGAEVRQLSAWGLRAAQVQAWVALDPARRKRVPFCTLLWPAVILGDVDAQDLPGWLDAAVTSRVPWTSQDTFVGEPLLRLARAGLSPAEAIQFLARDCPDWDSVALLAALRARR